MKLDKRIIEGKKPLDCFDTEIAKEFIGKKGLFGTYDSQFANLDTCPKCLVDELKSVDDYDDYPFITSRNHGYRLFLPAEWVKEPEKKYRPYSLSEWIEQHEIGDIIHYRCKSKEIELRHMYLGTRHTQESVKITLGDSSYSLECLFEDYEIEVDGEWKPFGVEVEEE